MVDLADSVGGWWLPLGIREWRVTPVPVLRSKDLKSTVDLKEVNGGW